jgi:hypothetical protein
MAFSTRNARRQTMSAELRDWCATGSPEEQRTLVLKLSPNADVERLTAELRGLGAEIVSAGPAATVASISCGAAKRASELPGVIQVDAPRRLRPALGKQGSVH